MQEHASVPFLCLRPCAFLTALVVRLSFLVDGRAHLPLFLSPLLPLSLLGWGNSVGKLTRVR